VQTAKTCGFKCMTSCMLIFKYVQVFGNGICYVIFIEID
jgi:hypothetical protein